MLSRHVRLSLKDLSPPCQGKPTSSSMCSSQMRTLLLQNDCSLHGWRAPPICPLRQRNTQEGSGPRPPSGRPTVVLAFTCRSLQREIRYTSFICRGVYLTNRKWGKSKQCVLVWIRLVITPSRSCGISMAHRGRATCENGQVSSLSCAKWCQGTDPRKMREPDSLCLQGVKGPPDQTQNK